MTTSVDVILTAGRIVTGKWNKTSYRVERCLGEGANGKVYLVGRGRNLFAMKIGFDAVDLQSEVNVLKKLSHTSGAFQSYLIDVDDVHIGGKSYPFYVMKYVKGLHAVDFIKQRGEQWLGLLGLNLLDKLKELHVQGWIFGDIKAENMLVSEYGQVDLVDYGGVTAKGNAIKQFTEVYDRGYWGMGSRIADERYDLFAFAVLYLHLTGRAKECFSKLLLPQNRSVDLLKEKLDEQREYHHYVPLLKKMLDGEIETSQEAYQDWKELFYAQNRLPGKIKGNKKAVVWLQAGFVGSVLLFFTALYFYTS